MAGFGAPRRGPRLPPTVLLVLLAVLGLLAFNYWSVRGRQADLATELGALQAQAERTEVARLRLERRNSELVLLLEQHRTEARKEHEQRVSTEQRLSESLERQGRMQNNVSRLLAEIAHLKEQQNDQNQAFLQREDQIRELQINNTALLSRHEQDSLRCEAQVQQLKVQYEDRLKKLPATASVALHDQPGKQLGSSKEHEPNMDKAAIDVLEKHDLTVEGTSKILPQNVDEVKAGESDAGMPELEENGAANLQSIPSALKKASIIAPAAVFNLSNVPPQDSKLVPDAVAPVVLKPKVHSPPQAALAQPVEMQNKLLMESSLKNIIPKKRSGNIQNLKQSRFFDENESPVDPQPGSKVADYNGDDGNVGEYEGDKQADLAHNEEEDGGEEDVQDDEERDALEDPADYRKDSLKNAL